MDHIVDYHEWCDKCKFGKQDEDEYPCYECLLEPVKEDGKRPVYWVAGEDYLKEQRKKETKKTNPKKGR